jgi:hypothetical protein
MSPLTTSNEPIARRQCDSCTLCCKVMGITELQKARGTWCKHCSPGKGCGVYTTRPAECRSFYCGWLLNPRLGPEWKPSRSKIVLTPTPDSNGIAVRCDPGFPDAWRRHPVRRPKHVAETAALSEWPSLAASQRPVVFGRPLILTFWM